MKSRPVSSNVVRNQCFVGMRCSCLRMQVCTESARYGWPEPVVAALDAGFVAPEAVKPCSHVRPQGKVHHARNDKPIKLAAWRRFIRAQMFFSLKTGQNTSREPYRKNTVRHRILYATDLTYRQDAYLLFTQRIRVCAQIKTSHDQAAIAASRSISKESFTWEFVASLQK